MVVRQHSSSRAGRIRLAVDPFLQFYREAFPGRLFLAMSRYLLVPLFLLIGFFHVSLAHGQEGLPSGTDIMARCVKAMGSEEAVKNLKSIRYEGKIEQSKDLLANFILLKTRKGKGFTELEMQGDKSKFKSQTTIVANGDMVWISILGQKVKVEEPQSFCQRILLCLSAPLEYQDYFDEVKNIGSSEFEGVKCYELDCERDGNPLVTYFFSQETGLEAGFTVEVEERSDGYKVVYQDYRDVSGLKLPHRILFQDLSDEDVETVTIEKIIVNGDFDEKVFEIPKDLK